jgi:transcriptional regulator with XRE-family HTH domain
MTLREFCRSHDLDRSTISKMERGVIPPPPTQQKLGVLAAAVGLVEATAEWQEFMDRAYAARGEVPPDLAREDIYKRLPVIFRTLRRDNLSQEDLAILMQLIREA